jgi:catechol 2,3-dioxygenase-like lactoylglutathione lyase family enzyme
MKIRGVAHVAINTADIGRSVDFYGRILGWKQGESVPFEGFSLVYFDIPGGGRLELFDYGGKNPKATREESEAGLRHLAFAADDVDEAERHLRANGVPITMPATDLPSLKCRAILFLDPNGVTLELSQKMR